MLKKNTFKNFTPIYTFSNRIKYAFPAAPSWALTIRVILNDLLC